MTVQRIARSSAIRASQNDLGEANMKTVTALFRCLFAASLCAAASTCAHAASPPGIDCAKTRVSVEKLICRDPQLTQMDIELTRLYRLALTDERSVPPRTKSSSTSSSGSMPAMGVPRDRSKRCASSAVMPSVRTSFAKARPSCEPRIRPTHRRPLAFRCAGFNTLITATFFSTQPGVVYLKWANTAITLSQVPSDSGTRYTGKDYQGNYSFWQDGNAVLFQKPGSREMSCTVEPVS